MYDMLCICIVQIEIAKKEGVMKKLISFMVSFLAIATMNLFSMHWDREGVMSDEHARDLTQAEENRRLQERENRRLQEEREWQEYRARQAEADREERRAAIYDIRSRKDRQGKD